MTNKDIQFVKEAVNLGKAEGTCNRGYSGAILVDDFGNIISMGVVGVPEGVPSCNDVGHLMKRVFPLTLGLQPLGRDAMGQTEKLGEGSDHCMRTIHAETEAVALAAKRGVMTAGSTCYCKMTPCRNCAMVLIQAGITRIVCEKHYHSETESVEMFKQVGMKIEWVEDCIEEYK